MVDKRIEEKIISSPENALEVLSQPNLLSAETLAFTLARWQQPLHAPLSIRACCGILTIIFNHIRAGRSVLYGGAASAISDFFTGRFREALVRGDAKSGELDALAFTINAVFQLTKSVEIPTALAIALVSVVPELPVGFLGIACAGPWYNLRGNADLMELISSVWKKFYRSIKDVKILSEFLGGISGLVQWAKFFASMGSPQDPTIPAVKELAELAGRSPTAEVLEFHGALLESLCYKQKFQLAWLILSVQDVLVARKTISVHPSSLPATREESLLTEDQEDNGISPVSGGSLALLQEELALEASSWNNLSTTSNVQKNLSNNHAAAYEKSGSGNTANQGMADQHSGPSEDLGMEVDAVPETGGRLCGFPQEVEMNVPSTSSAEAEKQHHAVAEDSPLGRPKDPHLQRISSSVHSIKAMDETACHASDHRSSMTSEDPLETASGRSTTHSQPTSAATQLESKTPHDNSRVHPTGRFDSFMTESSQKIQGEEFLLLTGPTQDSITAACRPHPASCRKPLLNETLCATMNNELPAEAERVPCIVSFECEEEDSFEVPGVDDVIGMLDEHLLSKDKGSNNSLSIEHDRTMLGSGKEEVILSPRTSPGSILKIAIPTLVPHNGKPANLVIVDASTECDPRQVGGLQTLPSKSDGVLNTEMLSQSGSQIPCELEKPPGGAQSEDEAAQGERESLLIVPATGPRADPTLQPELLDPEGVSNTSCLAGRETSTSCCARGTTSEGVDNVCHLAFGVQPLRAVCREAAVDLGPCITDSRGVVIHELDEDAAPALSDDAAYQSYYKVIVEEPDGKVHVFGKIFDGPARPSSFAADGGIPSSEAASMSEAVRRGWNEPNVNDYLANVVQFTDDALPSTFEAYSEPHQWHSWQQSWMDQHGTHEQRTTDHHGPRFTDRRHFNSGRQKQSRYCSSSFKRARISSRR